MVQAGDSFPQWSWPQAGGGKMSPARAEGWRMLVVYRGKHCGLCKKYLAQLESMRKRFEDIGVAVSALSADAREKAEAQVSEGGLSFPVGHDLDVEQMRELGLYVSPPTEEADRPFAEPGVFVLNPHGVVQVVNVSNAPFARPELEAMAKGIEAARKNDAPIHGLA